MSRERVITGADDRGRPIGRWADTAAEAPRYGHMEPAWSGSPIERSRLTPDEVAERAARAEARSGHLEVRPPNPRPALNSPEHLQQSRLNGARRHVEVMAAEKRQQNKAMAARMGIELPPEEEPAMPSDHAPDPLPGSPLERVAAAALEAERARQAKAAADEAWLIAREALDAAMAGVQRLLAGDVDPAPATAAWVDETHLMTLSTVGDDAPDITRRPTSKPSTAAAAKRQPGRHPAKAGEAAEKAERLRKVMEAMARLGGDQRAVAAELGMKANAVAMVVKFAPAEATA